MRIKSKMRAIAISVVFSILITCSYFSPSAYALDIYETENNNTVSVANVTYDDYNNYGSISSASDVDWWKITFSQSGSANFWIGNIPSGCQYNLYLYENDGRLLLACAEHGTSSKRINARVYAGVTYTIKIVSGNSAYSSSNYLFRIKNYTDQRNARVFTFSDTNGVINFNENATTILPYLYDMDYNAARFYNRYANVAFEEIPESDLVVITNHALPGEMKFYNSTLYADTTIYNQYNAGLGNYDAGDLSRIKLMTFAGCNSGDTSSMYGNLVDSAKNKGVYCCIGWTESFYHDDIINWHNAFYESLYYGNTVSIAIADANLALLGNALEYSSISAQYYGTSPLSSLTLS